MRSAETVLGIIRDRGKRGLPLERVYRLLYNRDLYLLAYGKIARNHGALTPGATPETADGMTLAKIDALIEALRFERHRWTPVRRTYVPKANGKQRPLGLPTWSDKLLQEVLRLILDAYYEPQFSGHSHGFRPGRGCHTALREVYRAWPGTAWFLELDVAQFFDRLDHRVLLGILAERLHDGRFLRLLAGLLAAGYLENWRFNATLSGVPQGGIVSPVLANVYLDRLDQYVETTLLPAHNRGDRRRPHPTYARLLHRATYLRRTGHRREARVARRQAQRLPSVDPDDAGYRRLRYVRYADDVLLGFNGPRAEAEALKRDLGAFLRDALKLELSEAKTLLTHARTGAARFLGYEIAVLAVDAARDRHDRRATNGQIGLRVPADVIRTKCRPYLRHGKPAAWAECLHDAPFSILVQFQQVFRGVANYYQMAYNLHRLDILRYAMERSLVRTLSDKLRLSTPQVYRRFGATLQTPAGPRKGLEVRVEREGKRPLVAQWGGVSLRWHVDAVLDDRPPRAWNARTEVLERLLADTCELCGSHDRVQVHHVRHLKDLQAHRGRPVPAWVEKMAARHRKTLVACHDCHVAVHAGRPARARGAA
jgi:group II intron reverse transcriptase/maturase